MIDFIKAKKRNRLLAIAIPAGIAAAGIGIAAAT